MQQNQIVRKHRRPFTIDVEKIKRWHGAPPLLAGQSESDFCGFIKSLEACVEYGDALTESLLYRYGIETYTMGQLLALRSLLMNVQRKRTVRLLERDTERQKHREGKQRDRKVREPAVKENPDFDFVRIITIDTAHEDIKRSMYYTKRLKIDEMAAALGLESAIALHTKLDSAISRCAARKSELLRQIALHGLQVTERIEQEGNEIMMACIEEAQEMARARPGDYLDASK